MDIEKIISDSIKKLSDDFESRKEIFLDLLHKNIDILAQNANQWFGSDIPRDFSKVMYSLMSLTLGFNKFSSDYNSLLHHQNYTDFSPVDLFEEIYEEIISLTSLKNIHISSDENITIRTSRTIFRDSIYNIFFSLYYYVAMDSEAFISILKENSTIKVKITMKSLSENLPDADKISRSFYYTKDNQEYKIKPGLTIGLSNLRQIGGIVKLAKSNRDLSIVVSFPSTDFLNMVEDIRSSSEKPSVVKKSGLVLLSFQDKILEMITQQIVSEKGYGSEIFLLDKKYKWDILSKRSNCQAIIIDYDNLIKNYNDIYDFTKKYADFKKIIIIMSSDNNEKFNLKNENIYFLPRPFGEEQLIGLVEEK